MSERKRDQRQYDLIQQYLPGLILNTILKIVNDLGDPHTARPSLGGMTAYPPRAMAAVCIVMEAERKTYRKMVGHLRNNRDTVAKIGLRKIPSKSTIARAYGLIPDRYLAEVHRRVICEISAGSVAGDSTGYSDSSFIRWYDVRTDNVKTKRGWVKIYSIIDIRTRVVLDYLVTASNVADIIGLRSMLAGLEGGAGHFCLDSAYLARGVCSAISKIGTVPRIKPKSNTIHNAFGSQAWREMVDLSVQDPDTFKSEYHQRSVIEAVFGAIKKMYGNHTRCHKPENQCREIAIRVICYNIELVARSKARDGRFTPKMIATMTA